VHEISFGKFPTCHHKQFASQRRSLLQPFTPTYTIMRHVQNINVHRHALYATVDTCGLVFLCNASSYGSLRCAPGAHNHTSPSPPRSAVRVTCKHARSANNGSAIASFPVTVRLFQSMCNSQGAWSTLIVAQGTRRTSANSTCHTPCRRKP
jgi:hypothetical protein